MAESGRILHHLANHVGDHKTLVLFVGFQGEHTLGRRIQDGARVVKIFGEELPVRAGVETIGGYSAHADRNELRGWLRKLGGPIKRAFVVHGEREATLAMAQLLKEEGVRQVDVPAQGESFDLG
jgi:metallo-beta-lactamase family protein